MKFSLFIVMMLVVVNLQGQQNTNISHRYTVALNENFRELTLYPSIHTSSFIKSVSRIDPSGSILSVEFENDVPLEVELKWLKQNSSIKDFQPVFKLETRGCNPNDKEYWRQYNMELMKFDEVWCYKKDGISPLGDTIVIGAIDGGFSFEYQDLLPN